MRWGESPPIRIVVSADLLDCSGQPQAQIRGSSQRGGSAVSGFWTGDRRSLWRTWNNKPVEVSNRVDQQAMRNRLEISKHWAPLAAKVAAQFPEKLLAGVVGCQQASLSSPKAEKETWFTWKPVWNWFGQSRRVSSCASRGLTSLRTWTSKKNSEFRSVKDFGKNPVCHWQNQSINWAERQSFTQLQITVEGMGAKTQWIHFFVHSFQ